MRKNRRTRNSRRVHTGTEDAKPKAPVVAGLQADRFRPLSETQIADIDVAAKEMLHRTGLTDAPAILVEKACLQGAHVDDDARLCIPPGMVDNALADLAKPLTLFGQIEGHELKLGEGRVYTGTGGAAPMVIDLKTGKYRDSTLRDLYDCARMADTLEHIHFFSRTVVARDVEDPLEFDLNTAYASLIGTKKHVMTSVSSPENVSALAEMCFEIAGSEDAFRKRPFLSLNINHVTPPMRLSEEACEVLIKAVEFGIPAHCNTFGQLGASSPVTFAGSIAQTIAESLAGIVFAWLIDPGAKVIFGPRPMVTDLRTGSMSGGSGEQALATAATAQIANWYGLPNSVISGATDSKIPDAQSGFEKSLNITLAAQAGANLITQACGMHAGLMATAFESFVIDNDMLGAILRSLSPIEVTPETLNVQSVDEVAKGEGHFLGHPDTYDRMHSDFLYPGLADRRSPQEWEEAGSRDVREIARGKAGEILANHHPDHIDQSTDRKIRDKFNILLNRA